MKKILLIALTLVSFLITGTIGPLPALSQDYHLPVPGVMVHLSQPLELPILRGIKVHPDSPFSFDFILDQGDALPTRGVSPSQRQTPNALKFEATKLIKYFLAGLTIPEKDLWVNLSPYEKERIIPNSFGLTEMGRDLLAEDYMLKQITASLIYPQDGVGKDFWKRVYEEAAQRFHTTDIPINTFNKVWILPEKAVVYENSKVGAAYVVESQLKVMLEEDYLSLSHYSKVTKVSGDISSLGSQILRQIVIPQLTKEVNEGKNFARLRQVYHSLILATWYKKKIKDGILTQVYTDKNKIAGVNNDDPQEKEKIYQRYLKAFKKGVYNYIKEDQDPITQQMVAKKYFSGGATFLRLKNIARFFDQQTVPARIKSLIKNVRTGLIVVAASLSIFSPSFAQSFPQLPASLIQQSKDKAMTGMEKEENEIYDVFKQLAMQEGKPIPNRPDLTNLEEVSDEGEFEDSEPSSFNDESVVDRWKLIYRMAKRSGMPNAVLMANAYRVLIAHKLGYQIPENFYDYIGEKLAQILIKDFSSYTFVQQEFVIRRYLHSIHENKFPDLGAIKKSLGNVRDYSSPKVDTNPYFICIYGAALAHLLLFHLSYRKDAVDIALRYIFHLGESGDALQAQYILQDAEAILLKIDQMMIHVSDEGRIDDLLVHVNRAAGLSEIISLASIYDGTDLQSASAALHVRERLFARRAQVFPLGSIGEDTRILRVMYFAAPVIALGRRSGKSVEDIMEDFSRNFPRFPQEELEKIKMWTANVQAGTFLPHTNEGLLFFHFLLAFYGALNTNTAFEEICKILEWESNWDEAVRQSKARYHELGAQIHQWRLERGMTVRDLVYAIKRVNSRVKPTQLGIADIEKGTNFAREEFIEALPVALGLNEDEVMILNGLMEKSKDTVKSTIKQEPKPTPPVGKEFAVNSEESLLKGLTSMANGTLGHNPINIFPKGDLGSMKPPKRKAAPRAQELPAASVETVPNTIPAETVSPTHEEVNPEDDATIMINPEYTVLLRDKDIDTTMLQNSRRVFIKLLNQFIKNPTAPTYGQTGVWFNRIGESAPYRIYVMLDKQKKTVIILGYGTPASFKDKKKGPRDLDYLKGRFSDFNRSFDQILADPKITLTEFKDELPTKNGNGKKNGGGNPAMTAQKPGGIDLASINKLFQSSSKDGGIKFRIDAAMVQELQKAPGLTVGSITLTPLKSLPQFLGMDQ